MKRLLAVAAAGMLLAFAGANAHTRLESSNPVDKAVLASPPSEIALHFSEATRLTALTIQNEGGEEQHITSVLPKSASAHVNVPLPQMGPGTYVVNWRAVGPDNHVMKGALHFTIAK